MRMFKSLATGIITIALFVVVAIINVSAAEVTIEPSGDKTGEKDYFAIQEVLSAASEVEDNESTVINLVEGNYYIKYGLMITGGGSNITVKGPKTAVVNQVTAGSGILGNAAVAGGYDSNHNITIDGCTWVAKYEECDGFSVMLFSHADGVTIKNAVFKNAYKGHHVELAGVKNAVITNCDFGGVYAGPEGAADEAIQLDITHSPEVCGHLGVDKDDKEMQAIVFDDTACDNVEIKDNVINFSRGIGSHYAVENRPHTNITIKNNKITATDKGIYLHNYYYAKVYNNTITSGETGILAKTEITATANNTNITSGITDVNNRAIQIYDNVLNSCGAFGIRILGTASLPVNYTVIKNNTVNATGNSGILLSYASYCTVTNNKLNNIGALDKTIEGQSALVQLNGTKNIITYNTVKTSRDIGIRTVGASYSTVKYNNLSNLEGYGISVTESSNNSTVENNVVNKSSIGIRVVSGSYGTLVQNNTLSNMTDRGVVVTQSASVKVALNKITTTGGYGIHFQVNSTAGEITNNTIKNTKDKGIQVRDIGDMVKVVSNTISSAGDTGIAFLNVTTPYIVNNVVATAKGAGVSVNSAQTVTITGNNLANTKGNGIAIYTTKTATVTRNNLDNIKGNGIAIYTAQGATVTSNSVKNSTNNGLRIVDCKSANVSLNKVTTSGDNGISVANTKITLQNNSFDKSTDNGIYIVNCPKSTVANNITTNNKLRGIRITSKSHSIYVANNKISNNKGDGIMIDGSNNATITKNTISGNCKRYGVCLLSGKGLKVTNNEISGSFVSPINVAKAVKSSNVKKMVNLKVDKVKTKSKKAKKMKITGSCDENSTVKIKLNNKTYKTKKQKGNKSSFVSTKKIKVKPKNVLKVIQTDKAKNTYTKTVKVVK